MGNNGRVGTSEPELPAPTEQEQEAGATRRRRAALVRFGVVAALGVLLGLATGLLVRGCQAGRDSTSPSSSTGVLASATATETTVPQVPASREPLATPTNTPDPATLREEGDLAVQDGDYSTAAERYTALLGGPGSVGVEPRLALGMVLLRDGQYALAVEVLQGASAVPEHGAEADARAHFFLAEALVGTGEPQIASEHYLAYIASGTVITGYVQEWIGDALREAGVHAGAAEAYRFALAEATDRSVELGLREKIALSHTAQEDYEAAIAEYRVILSIAPYPGYRAHIGYQAAETELLAGQTDAAMERHLGVIQSYPAEASAHPSLVRLLEAGVPVDDRLRGIVDYYADAYEPAVLALTRYYLDNPTTHAGDVHWFAGESYLALDDPANAAREFSLLIDTHPGHELVDASWFGLAQATAAAGDAQGAVYTYEKFAELRPLSERAAEALWEAALLQERSGALDAASEAYAECQAQYPDSEYADQAMFRSGLASFRVGDGLAAAVAWDALAATTEVSSQRAAGLFWLGRLRTDQSDPDGAATAFLTAARADPLSYYGLRAAQLADDPLALPFPSRGAFTAVAGEGGQDEAEAWLAGWLEVERAELGAALGAELAEDPRLQRGLELWSLGRLVEGRAELEALRGAHDGDPLALYQLALLYREIGLYRSSIICAARLIGLSPAANVLDAPAFIGRLAYPDYYRRLVTQNAAEFGLEPLLVFSVVRQESLFESLATSSAAAHGLMQVIPPTGEQIAATLGWPPDYQTADLYRPYVSVQFGAFYLATQHDLFSGRTEVALAAYNGGPGNAARWAQAAGDDPDLFVELIAFSGTRQYVRRIGEHLAVYQALYAE